MQVKYQNKKKKESIGLIENAVISVDSVFASVCLIQRQVNCNADV